MKSHHKGGKQTNFAEHLSVMRQPTPFKMIKVFLTFKYIGRDIFFFTWNLSQEVFCARYPDQRTQHLDSTKQ